MLGWLVKQPDVVTVVILAMLLAWLVISVIFALRNGASRFWAVSLAILAALLLIVFSSELIQIDFSFAIRNRLR